jgi:hypothetical protein
VQAQDTLSGTITTDQAPGQVTVCLYGDLNCDCQVNVVDVMLVAGRWGSRAGDEDYDPLYDLNDDGVIDVVDIMLVAAHWGETCQK